MTDMRIIKTKRKTYLIPAEQEGTPMEQLLGTEVATRHKLTGAKVYQTKDGPVIARPWPEK